MNRQGFFVLMLVGLFGIVGSAQSFDACMTGSWYDPDRDGEGINIEALDEVVIVYFYRPLTTGNHWYTFIGNRVDGPVPLDMYDTILAGTYKVGEAVIEQLDENTLAFEYLQLLNEGGQPWCIGCIGSFEYIRLTTPISCE